MKFRISMKTPDALDYAINDALTEPDADILGEEAIDERKDELKELCEQWFSYGECLTIEIDTDAKTATVLKARR